MKKMVIVKYLGIPMSVDAKGQPTRIIDPYSNGTITLRVGEVSPPIEATMALQLQNDFGNKAFEIVRFVEVPETNEEEEALNNLIEDEEALVKKDEEPKEKEEKPKPKVEEHIDKTEMDKQKKTQKQTSATVLPKIEVKKRRRKTKKAVVDVPKKKKARKTKKKK